MSGPSQSRRAPPLAAAACLLAVAAALEPARAQDARGPVLALGGDVIFDAPVLYAIDRFFDDQPAPALRELLSELEPSLAGADLAIVNLECPVAPRVHVRGPDHDAPTFAAPPELLSSLAAVGVDAVTVANNHAYDQGVEGLASTLEEARRAGLPVIGGGRDAGEAARALVLEAGGHRVAVAAFTEGTNRRVRDGDPETPRIATASEERIAESVRAARRDAALVVVSLHWTSPLDGRPLDGRPTRTMVRLASAAAEAGADLVYAHGPHLPARAGRVRTADGREVPVLWSLGNLVAAMELDEERVHAPGPSVRDALVARVVTRPRADRRLEVAAIEEDAYWIATPQRAWWDAPTSAMVRPLSLRRELARIERAGCGARCDRYAASYRARERMLASLLGAPSSEPAEPGPPPPRRRTSRSASVSVGPVPPELARGVRLRVSFPLGSAVPAAIDHAQVRALADQLLADRSLRVEITARCARSEESSALALQRAHRARGLLAILGPSRARFALRAGPPGDDPEIVLRFVR